jgi:Uma2 family endonuclease
MTRTLSHPPSVDLDDIQHFVLEDASWELYERFLREIGDRPVRVTYDSGKMEIISPLPEHEGPKKIIGDMIEMLCFELRIPVICLGSTTFRRKIRAKGLEPDECYYIENEPRIRGKRRLNLRTDPPPDLAVEIDVTTRSVPRQRVYAALGVPEIWRYDGKRIQCLHLIDGEYHARKFSLAFPFLEPASLKQFLGQGSFQDKTAVLRSFVDWVRDENLGGL